LDKAAFLYVGDIVSDPSFPGFSEEMDIKAGSVEGDPLEAEDLPEPSEDAAAAASAAEPPPSPPAGTPEPAAQLSQVGQVAQVVQDQPELSKVPEVPPEVTAEAAPVAQAVEPI